VGIKIGNTNITDVNVGLQDISQVYQGTNLIWQKNVGNSYWVDEDGVKHYFNPNNTPFANFCTSDGYIVIDGQNILKNEIIILSFDGDYASIQIGDNFLANCSRLNSIVWNENFKTVNFIGNNFLIGCGITFLDLEVFTSIAAIGDGFCKYCNNLDTIFVPAVDYTTAWFVSNVNQSFIKEDNTYDSYSVIGNELGVTSFQTVFPPIDVSGAYRSYSTNNWLSLVNGSIMYFDANSIGVAEWSNHKVNYILANRKKIPKANIVEIHFIDVAYATSAVAHGGFIGAYTKPSSERWYWGNLQAVTFPTFMTQNIAIQEGSFVVSSNFLGVNYPWVMAIYRNSFVIGGGIKETAVPTHDMNFTFDNLINVARECFQINPHFQMNDTRAYVSFYLPRIGLFNGQVGDEYSIFKVNWDGGMFTPAEINIYLGQNNTTGALRTYRNVFAFSQFVPSLQTNNVHIWVYNASWEFLGTGGYLKNFVGTIHTNIDPATITGYLERPWTFVPISAGGGNE